MKVLYAADCRIQEFQALKVYACGFNSWTSVFLFFATNVEAETQTVVHLAQSKRQRPSSETVQAVWTVNGTWRWRSKAKRLAGGGTGCRNRKAQRAQTPRIRLRIRLRCFQTRARLRQKLRLNLYEPNPSSCVRSSRGQTAQDNGGGFQNRHSQWEIFHVLSRLSTAVCELQDVQQLPARIWLVMLSHRPDDPRDLLVSGCQMSLDLMSHVGQTESGSAAGVPGLVTSVEVREQEVVFVCPKTYPHPAAARHICQHNWLVKEWAVRRPWWREGQIFGGLLQPRYVSVWTGHGLAPPESVWLFVPSSRFHINVR